MILIKELSKYFKVPNVTDFKNRLRSIGVYPLVANKRYIDPKDLDKVIKRWL